MRREARRHATVAQPFQGCPRENCPLGTPAAAELPGVYWFRARRSCNATPGASEASRVCICANRLCKQGSAAGMSRDVSAKCVTLAERLAKTAKAEVGASNQTDIAGGRADRPGARLLCCDIGTEVEQTRHVNHRLPLGWAAVAAGLHTWRKQTHRRVASRSKAKPADGCARPPPHPIPQAQRTGLEALATAVGLSIARFFARPAVWTWRHSADTAPWKSRRV